MSFDTSFARRYDLRSPVLTPGLKQVKKMTKTKSQTLSGSRSDIETLGPSISISAGDNVTRDISTVSTASSLVSTALSVVTTVAMAIVTTASTVASSVAHAATPILSTTASSSRSPTTDSSDVPVMHSEFPGQMRAPQPERDTEVAHLRQIVNEMLGSFRALQVQLSAQQVQMQDLFDRMQPPVVLPTDGNVGRSQRSTDEVDEHPFSPRQEVPFVAARIERQPETERFVQSNFVPADGLFRRTEYASNVDSVNLVPIFDGNVDPVKWLRLFEGVSAAYGWSEKECRIFFPLRLSGNAYLWFETVSEEVATRWTSLRQQFLACFKRSENSDRKSEELARRKKSADETLARYYHAVVHLCQQVDDRMSLKQTLKHLIRGLPPAQQTLVKFSGPRTLEQFLETAGKAEGAVPIVRDNNRQPDGDVDQNRSQPSGRPPDNRRRAQWQGKKQYPPRQNVSGQRPMQQQQQQFSQPQQQFTQQQQQPPPSQGQQPPPQQPPQQSGQGRSGPSSKRQKSNSRNNNRSSGGNNRSGGRDERAFATQNDVQHRSASDIQTSPVLQIENVSGN